MITSPSNPQIRALAALHKRSERESTGTFLIEGRREIERAYSAGFGIERIVLQEGAVRIEIDAEILEVGPEAFARIAYGRDGVIAVARIPTFDLASWSPPEVVLVAVAIEKPGNLGAMLRTCDAVGAGLLAVDAVTDITNPNAVRASTGALFSVPIAVEEGRAAIKWLRDSGYGIVVTTVVGGKEPWRLDLRGRVAVVIGPEADGLSDAWLDAADQRVTLPQVGEIDSLNASVTAGVLLYEVLRQSSA